METTVTFEVYRRWPRCRQTNWASPSSWKLRYIFDSYEEAEYNASLFRYIADGAEYKVETVATNILSEADLSPDYEYEGLPGEAYYGYCGNVEAA